MCAPNLYKRQIVYAVCRHKREGKRRALLALGQRVSESSDRRGETRSWLSNIYLQVRTYCNLATSHRRGGLVMRGYNEIERRRLLLFGALCTEWAKAKMPLRRGAPRSSQAGATIASLARIIPFANVALTLGWCKVLPFVRIVYARLLTFRTPYCLTSPNKKKERKGKADCQWGVDDGKNIVMALLPRCNVSLVMAFNASFMV